jgi:hypothetical protein
VGGNQHTRPVTDEDRQRLRELHAQGLGRNAIARRLERSPRTVSELAAEMELSFDRTMTAVATEARKADAQARRTALVERYYEQAHKHLDRLDRDEHTIKEVSMGKVVAYQSDDLPAQDVRALLQASAAAATQAAKLEALAGDPGTDAAQSMLTSLADGIRRLAGAPEDDDGEG